MEKVRHTRDYLHLYLGCECQTDENKIGWFSGFDVCERDYSITMITVRFSDKSDDWTVLNDNEECDRIKLILRPLSDINEEECQELTLKVLNAGISEENEIILDEVDLNIVRGDGGLLVDGDCAVVIELSCRCFEGQIVVRNNGDLELWQEDDTVAQCITGQTEQFRWLLSKGFDLFGLIEEGLAIDKTKGEIKTELI